MRSSVRVSASDQADKRHRATARSASRKCRCRLYSWLTVRRRAAPFLYDAARNSAALQRARPGPGNLAIGIDGDMPQQGKILVVHMIDVGASGLVDADKMDGLDLAGRVGCLAGKPRRERRAQRGQIGR